MMMMKALLQIRFKLLIVEQIIVSAIDSLPFPSFLMDGIKKVFAKKLAEVMTTHHISYMHISSSRHV